MTTSFAEQCSENSSAAKPLMSDGPGNQMDRSIDSLTAVAMYLELQRQGQNIPLENFIGNNLRCSCGVGLGNTITNLCDKRNFTRKELSDVPAKEAQRMLAECFAAKEQLGLGDVTNPAFAEDYMVLLQQIWPKVLKHSFVLVDENNQLCGVALRGDYVDFFEAKLEGLNLHLTYVLRYLRGLIEKAIPMLAGDLQKPGMPR